MFETKYDDSKNRVYVKLEGMMTIEEAIKYEAAVRKEVDKATEGYTFCIDMEEAQPAPKEVNDYLSDIRNYMANKKTKGSAMIVSSEVTKLQLSRLVKDLGGAYSVAQSYEEADCYLDSL